MLWLPHRSNFGSGNGAPPNGERFRREMAKEEPFSCMTGGAMIFGFGGRVSPHEHVERSPAKQPLKVHELGTQLMDFMLVKGLD